MMKIIKLTTYWSASEADVVLNFLDELREAIRLIYQDDIAELYESMAEEHIAKEKQCEIDFDDELDF